MTTKLAMDTGNFSYLCPDLFGIFRKSHRLQCTHCARCDFQNLLKNIRPYDPKNFKERALKINPRFRLTTKHLSVVWHCVDKLTVECEAAIDISDRFIYKDKTTVELLAHEGHVSVTFNSHWNQKSEKELYQPIHNFFSDMLNKGGNFGPQDEPFYSGEIFHRVTEVQMQEFVQTLTNATHQVADHIVENVSNNWAWKPDIYAYSFYTFEKFFDYTYHMVIDKECELDFEPDALYECPVFNLPLNEERRMYVKEDKLHDIVKDLLDFIEETDICNSNNVIWVRTILFNIGLAAFQTVCRTKELK